jgi:ankyrin repeat protein
MLAMAKRAKAEKAAEDLRLQEEEKKAALELEAENQFVDEFDDVVDSAVVDDGIEEYYDEDIDNDLSPLDILFQFIPYYGQGDPTNDATVRAYLSGLSLSEIDSKDEYGNTLLLLACQYNCDDLVRIMLNKGANPNAVNTSGASGLRFACYRESASKVIAKMLLHNGANPDLTEFVNGCTPLHYCASTGDVKFCEILINYGANLDIRDFYQYSSVDYAREAGFTDIVEYLDETLQRGFLSPNSYGSAIRSPHYNGQYQNYGVPSNLVNIGSPSGNDIEMGTQQEQDDKIQNKPQQQTTANMILSLSDPKVKEALAKVDEKHKNKKESEIKEYRNNLTNKEERMIELQSELDTLIRDITHYTNDVKVKETALEKIEKKEGKAEEELDSECQQLSETKKMLDKTKSEQLDIRNSIKTKVDDAEIKLNALSKADAGRVAAERKMAEERLAATQERENLFSMELNEMQVGFQNSNEKLKVELAELKRSYNQEQRAHNNTRGALQRDFDKNIESGRRTLHEQKTSQQKEATNLHFTREDTETKCRSATTRRNTIMNTLQQQQKDITDAKEALVFNKQIEGYIIREQTIRRTLHNQMEDLKGKIRVYVRVRPLSKKEKDRGCKEVVSKVGKNGLSLDMGDTSNNKQFDFDQVFTNIEDNSQEDIFRDSKHLVMSVVDGYNVCIFAYGQTGSGKTFTMIGGVENIQDAMKSNGEFVETAGIAPRAVSELFRLLNERSEQSTYSVDVTMFQIYRDGLQDLLRAPKKKQKKTKNDDDDPRQEAGLKITLAQHSSTGLVEVDGAVVETATNPTEVMRIFAEGSARRKVASTEMNAESSRSHLVCALVVNIISKKSGKKTTGKLTLVDLAGSERVEKSGASGDALKEAQSINKSLSALGDVIASLTSGSQHIPYRNHTLTMLMSDSIGGNAKTLMFVNTSPADYNSSETNSSLAFGNRCKDITNAVAAPPHVQAQQLKNLQKELAKLKKAGGEKKKTQLKPR